MRCNSPVPTEPILEKVVQNARGSVRALQGQIQSGGSSKADIAVIRPPRTVAVSE